MIKYAILFELELIFCRLGLYSKKIVLRTFVVNICVEREEVKQGWKKYIEVFMLLKHTPNPV